MAKQSSRDRRYDSKGPVNSYSMIKEDPSAADYCPRGSIEKSYPPAEYADLSYGKDLYALAQESLSKNRAALKREKASDPQYY